MIFDCLTEKQLLEIRIENIKLENKQRREEIRESKKRKAEYEKRLELLTNAQIGINISEYIEGRVQGNYKVEQMQELIKK